MALYLNGSKLDSILIGDGGGGGSVKPEIVSALSTPIGSASNTLSYTFTESGKFQYYAFKNYANAVSAVDIAITLNGTALTPSTHLESGGGFGMVYGEITVQAGDVIVASPTTAQSQRGLQLFIMKNCDVSAFSFLGVTTNNANTFSINTSGKSYLQVYQCSYTGGSNLFHYDVMDFQGDSIAVPSGMSKYYYGFTYAIALE